MSKRKQPNSPEPNEDKKKRVKPPATSKSLLCSSGISSGDKEAFRIRDKSFTVQVSLKGRCSPEVYALFDKLCRKYSEGAQIASRLANFIVRRILADSTEVPPPRLAVLFEPYGKATSGRSFHMSCISAIHLGKGSKVDANELHLFAKQMFGCENGLNKLNKFRFNEGNADQIRNVIGAQMVADVQRMIDTYMSTKPALWVRHELRRRCSGALESMKHESRKSLLVALSVPRLSIRKEIAKADCK